MSRTILKVAEVRLVYHNRKKASERPCVNSSMEAYSLLLRSWNKGKIELQEEFKILLLTVNNTCLGISTIASGGITDCLVDIRLIFATALKAGATKIILAHNHPSGAIDPSPDDRSFTGRCVAAGKLLGIEVTDHIVVTKENHYSFDGKGIMNKVASIENL